jgi:hypothetical protein
MIQNSIFSKLWHAAHLFTEEHSALWIVSHEIYPTHDVARALAHGTHHTLTAEHFVISYLEHDDILKLFQDA